MPVIKTIREDVLTQDEVRDMINKAETIQEKGLIAFLYLTGARISEALSMRPDDIQYAENNKIALFIWTEKLGDNSATKEKRMNKINRDTIFMDIIMRLKEITPVGNKIWNISRVHAWRILKRLNPNCYPHLFRHTRATRFSEKGFGETQQMQWFGWKSRTMPVKYTKRSPKLIESMSGEIE